MNVFITKANASRIVKSIDLSKAKIEGDIYKDKNQVLNAMFSKYEKHELLAYKTLMEDPEAFMSEIYEKISQYEDTYWWVYEKKNPPAYHFNSACPCLLSNFKNYKIPDGIRFKGIQIKGIQKDEYIKMFHSKYSHDNEAIINKVKFNVNNYRKWWEMEGEKLFLKDKDAFLMHVNNKYQPEPRILNITEFESGNSGVERLDNSSLIEIENKIDKLIRDSGIYYYLNKKNTTVLRHYAKWTSTAYKNGPFNLNSTGYTNEEIREVLIEYDKRFKFPLKNYLKEYYLRKNNPELKMDQKLLEQLGFRECLHCVNLDNMQNKDPRSYRVRGIGVPVEEEPLDNIGYWSDEIMELMSEVDEYNDDIVHREDLSGQED
ncbi:hypothetical protein NXY11_25510 [Parabacteroides faecis]|uniref:hypothetical protein n=1 Tax=Parabacteroides faecis TaxID=1217282 RepID=UPI0021640083|nr:hypothetical protein [Parabacteroides faecis]UVQ46444.1 hypothetical protein NXY11_25510 [Parabacteroides faecis]